MFYQEGGITRRPKSLLSRGRTFLSPFFSLFSHARYLTWSRLFPFLTPSPLFPIPRTSIARYRLAECPFHSNRSASSSSAVPSTPSPSTPLASSSTFSSPLHSTPFSPAFSAFSSSSSSAASSSMASSISPIVSNCPPSSLSSPSSAPSSASHPLLSLTASTTTSTSSPSPSPSVTPSSTMPPTSSPRPTASCLPLLCPHSSHGSKLLDPCCLSCLLSHRNHATQLHISLRGFFLILAALGFVLLLRGTLSVLSRTEPLLRRALRHTFLSQNDDALHSVGLLSFVPIVAIGSNAELQELFSRMCFVLILVSKYVW